MLILLKCHCLNVIAANQHQNTWNRITNLQQTACFICKRRQEIRTRTFNTCAFMFVRMLSCCFCAFLLCLLPWQKNIVIIVCIHGKRLVFSTSAALLRVKFNKGQRFKCNFPFLWLYLASACQQWAWNYCFYELSTNIGVRIRTMFSLFSVVDYNGLVCVFEFEELRRPSANTALPEAVNLRLGGSSLVRRLEMIT